MIATWILIDFKSSEVGKLIWGHFSVPVYYLHLESWHLDETPILVCTGMYPHIRSFAKTQVLIFVHTGMYEYERRNYDTQVAHSLWLFSEVWICSQTPPMTLHHIVESKMKKQCAEKEFGKLSIFTYKRVYSVYQYIFVYTEFVQNQWRLSFIIPWSDFLLSKHALIHLPCTVHRIMEPKSEKRSWILQPLFILMLTGTSSYNLVHACTYSYIRSYTTLYFESGGSRLAMKYCLCCTLVPCIAHSILPRCSLLNGQASQAGLVTPKLEAIWRQFRRGLSGLSQAPPPRRGLSRPNCHGWTW
jgi:hypothetical protein